MSERDAYVQKIKAQIDECNAQIKQLEARARKADAETQIKYEKEIKEYRQKRDQIKK